METEWKAKTGKVSLLTRSGATVRLAYNISKSVKKLEHELSAQPELDKEISERRWNELHRKNAKMVCQHILKYRGLLTKFGQAASTKAGSLPAPWVEELKGLQDELPISNFQEVVKTMKSDLGRPLEEVFHNFGQKPIASASVGQAHVAWLRSNGQKVCVKVQHNGVDSLMKTDLATIEFISNRMLKRHPDAPDFRDLIREWKRASREEVDFQLEAQNALQASRALKRHQLDVTCPEPIKSLCSQRVLTMVFIEGWKITDLDRMPYGADREGLARQLVSAFALLVFQEGLIHGDPHPGNVFVEPVPGQKAQVRPVLLDWGIVKRLTPEERLAAAKWVVSTLAQDRQLYTASLLDLGFEFADPDLPDFATFIEASMFQCGFMFRDSIPSSSQMNFLQQMQEHQEKADSHEQKLGKEPSKLVGKIPGVVLFFLRGLEMLQNICGMLEVTVPFATVMLQNCMPLLAKGIWDPAVALPAPPGGSVAEQKLRAKLHDLDSQGLILGAQVAVWDRRLGSFLCNVACGRLGVSQGIPISEQTVMPLMNLSAAPLLHGLLRAMSHTTAHGKQITLETRLVELWPDFSQRGKGASIGDVLRHEAGLGKPFPSDLSTKAFCNEQKLEEALAAAPLTPEDGLCPVFCELLASLLKRCAGRRSSPEALAAMLEGLAGDVTYRAPNNCHTALAGRRPQERVTMQSIYEWLEEKVESLDAIAQHTSSSRKRWLSEQELAVEMPWIADPLLVNRQALMIGHGCLAGRGLRASARTLCRLFTSELVPAETLAKSLEPAAEMSFPTLQQWWDCLGAPHRAAGGWQLFPFRTGSSEVQGYGFADGTTGSVVMRLPDITLAILLTSCSPETRHCGRALLETICQELNFQATWPCEPPPLPKRRGAAVPVKERRVEVKADGRRTQDLQLELSKVEEKVAKLSEVLEILLPGAAAAIVGSAPAPKAPSMEGLWLSAETEGLESILEALQVPAMMRSMASAARRTLQIEIEEKEITIASSTSVLGRQLEETTTRFKVGQKFSGEQALGGAYTAVASWDEGSTPPALHLAKQFATEGIQLDELFQIQADGRLALTTTLSSSQHQFGDRRVEIHQPDELQKLCSELGQDLVLPRQVSLPGCIKPLPGGSRVTGLGPAAVEEPEQEVRSLQEVEQMQLPSSVFLTVEAIKSTTYFKLDGETKPAPSELLQSLPLEIRNALERQAQSPCSAASPPAAVASALSTPVTAAISALTPAPRPRSFCWTACGTATLATCGALARAAALSTRGAIYLGGRLCSASDCKAPKLCDSQRTEATEEYTVQVDRSLGQRLGLRVDREEGELVVLEVTPGLVQMWNEMHPENQVREGDVLLAVNGQKGDCKTLMEMCKACTPLEMTFQRDEVPEPKQDLKPAAPEPSVPEQPVPAAINAPGLAHPMDRLLPVEPEVPAKSAEVAEVPTRAMPSVAKAKPMLPKVAKEAAGRPKKEVRGSYEPGASSKPEKVEKLLPGEEPIPGATCVDPRSRHQTLDIVAFSRMDPASSSCQICRAQVLSNGFDLGRPGMAVHAPCSRSASRFRNAEAAYQATWNWPLSGLFRELSAFAAVKKVQRFGSYCDKSRGGFGSSWRAMRAVLSAKFELHRDILLSTKEAFLLDTGDVGDGIEEVFPNWLGAMLMALRDEMSQSRVWTAYLEAFLDLGSGAILDRARFQEWHKAVQGANAALKRQLAALADMDAV